MALTALELKALRKKPGVYADGGGLYLRVQGNQAASWVFRFQLHGRRRVMGLGSLDDVTAIDARAKAGALLQLVKAGTDPLEQKAAEEKAAAPIGDTFKEIAEAYIAAHRDGWANSKHAAQWAATLQTYAYPPIGGKRVSEITTDDVLKVLQPIWNTKNETASRVRSRIELVLSFAKAKKLRGGENPAGWRGNLDMLLPKPTKVKKVRHHPALPYALMPEFMAALRDAPGFGARALEFCILTAARSGEVRGATWAEIDLPGRMWRVPAARMKMRREHRVPLSDAAAALLEALPRIEGDPLVFPAVRSGKPMSDMTLLAVIRRMNDVPEGTPVPWVDAAGEQVVPHGFRSAFRDWAAERTAYPHELAEMALAHAVGNKVEAAYRRGDMVERRAQMMRDWAIWCGFSG